MLSFDDVIPKRQACLKKPLPSMMISCQRHRRHSAATRTRSQTPSWRSTRSSVPAGSTRAPSRKTSRPKPASSATETGAETAAEEEQGEKKKKKRRRKGHSKFTSPKGNMKGRYVPSSTSGRKQAPQQRRRRKVPVPTAYKEVDCRAVPQRKMRDCISNYYLAVLLFLGEGDGGAAASSSFPYLSNLTESIRRS